MWILFALAYSTPSLSVLPKNPLTCINPLHIVVSFTDIATCASFMCLQCIHHVLGSFDIKFLIFLSNVLVMH